MGVFNLPAGSRSNLGSSLLGLSGIFPRSNSTTREHRLIHHLPVKQLAGDERTVFFKSEEKAFIQRNSILWREHPAPIAIGDWGAAHDDLMDDKAGLLLLGPWVWIIYLFIFHDGINDP